MIGYAILAPISESAHIHQDDSPAYLQKQRIRVSTTYIPSKAEHRDSDSSPKLQMQVEPTPRSTTGFEPVDLKGGWETLTKVAEPL